MTKGESGHSIQGNWRGRYFYRSSSDAHGFEAVFIDICGRVEGNILDDGSLGEAVVAGTFGYPSIEFTKIYYRKTAGGAVKYRGTMSEDGKMLSGTWQRPGSVSGTWVAVRTDEQEALKFAEWQDGQLEDEVYEPQTAAHKSRR
jgi:hypothetical protein